MASPHDILGVSPDASPDEVRAAYTARLREAHPDTGGDTAHAARSISELRAARDAMLRPTCKACGGRGVVVGTGFAHKTCAVCGGAPRFRVRTKK